VGVAVYQFRSHYQINQITQALIRKEFSTNITPPVEGHAHIPSFHPFGGCFPIPRCHWRRQHGVDVGRITNWRDEGQKGPNPKWNSIPEFPWRDWGKSRKRPCRGSKRIRPGHKSEALLYERVCLAVLDEKLKRDTWHLHDGVRKHF
jgi:hypothetical protein